MMMQANKCLVQAPCVKNTSMTIIHIYNNNNYIMLARHWVTVITFPGPVSANFSMLFDKFYSN